MIKHSNWSLEEDLILRENYFRKREEICQLLPRWTYAEIITRARRHLKLKKPRNEACNSDLSILMEDNVIVYYWLGFILSDGCISEGSRLTVQLAITDTQHLEKLAIFLKTKTRFVKTPGPRKDQTQIRCGDKYWIPQIAKKFDIRRNKTYNPPDFLPDNLSLFLSMLIGFIDGDGGIYARHIGNPVCTIKIHTNWIPWLAKVRNRLIDLGFQIPPITISTDKYAIFRIGRIAVLTYLKIFAIENKLPVLNRKWDLIDPQKIDKKLKKKLNYRKVIDLYKRGIGRSQISVQLKIPYGTVSSYIRSYRKFTVDIFPTVYENTHASPY